jgi:tRNA dimethylallyltransferase
MSAQCGNQGLRPCGQGNSLGNNAIDDAGWKPFKQRNALAQSGLEVYLAAHCARRDCCNKGFQSDKIGQFIDALLTDHRRIHIRQEQSFATPLLWLDNEIDGERLEAVLQTPNLRAGRVIDQQVGSDAAVQPVPSRRLDDFSKPRQKIVGQNGGCRMSDEGRDVGCHRMRFTGGGLMHSHGSTLLIAGPTASGKSALAMRLAARLNGAIINADSMQVYRDLSIITARPSPADMARVPHFLFGDIDAAENYSVARYVSDTAAAIAAVRRAGRLPILVGGTGLYFKALTIGMSAIPAVPQAVREKIRHETIGLPAAELHRRLSRDDPATAARLRPSDAQRVVRALEVFAATGRPLISFQHGQKMPLLPRDWTGFFLAAPRPELSARIDARFDAMIAAGAVDEVERLAARKLDPSLPVMRAHGVPGLIEYLNGHCSLASAIARGKSDTRHYMKRQYTWARHQLPGFQWLATAAELSLNEALLLRHWGGHLSPSGPA